MHLVSRFPLVTITLIVGGCTAALIVIGQQGAAQLLASGFALAIAGYRSVSMIRGLLQGQLGIDLLAVAAIGSTVAVGEYVASLIIVLMLTGGQALEDFAQGRAARELRALLDRSPRVAHRDVAGGSPEEVPVEAVLPGDILVVKPAELVPVDGTLLSDAGTFDEAALTGESLPVDRVQGEALLSGTINGAEAVRMVATATAASSQYSQIVALVREASASRAPMVRMADRYAVPFTFFAFLLAGLGWFVSGDPGRFAEVLVVATPCPLLIAAPVAFLAGTSRAARAGIIIKNAGTLERLSRVRTAVFDKTGTLTSGHPTLSRVQVAGGASPAMTPDRVLQLAASAEQYSSHVLAGSVIAAAEERGLTLLPAANASEHATEGVSAVCSAGTVVVGKPVFVRSRTTGFEPAALHGGQLGIYVGVDGVFAGALIMSDPLRLNAAETLTELERLGVTETVLLTGDTSVTADHIAREAAITRVVADCLPGDKVRVVASLPLRPVLMVGDGVNDAPVLASADVGIAMGAKGATAASESADVVLLVDDLSRVATAVEIGQHTVRVARTSIWTGIILSVGLMIAAVFGMIPAVTGALLQELVDLAAILNALRALGAGRSARTQPAQRERINSGQAPRPVQSGDRGPL